MGQYIPPVARLAKVNTAGAAAPTVTDDANAGYAATSLWFDLTNRHLWACLDATAGAAEWHCLTHGSFYEKFTKTADESTTDTPPTYTTYHDVTSSLAPVGDYEIFTELVVRHDANDKVAVDVLYDIGAGDVALFDEQHYVEMKDPGSDQRVPVVRVGHITLASASTIRLKHRYAEDEMGTAHAFSSKLVIRRVQ